MRSARVVLTLLSIVIGCGDDGVVIPGTSSGSSDTTAGTSTGELPTTGTPTTTNPSTDSTSGVSATGSSSTGEPITSGSSSTGSTTIDDTSTGDTTTGTSTDGSTGTSTSTGTTDDSSSTGDGSSSSSGGDSTTGDVEFNGLGYLGMSGSNSLVRFDPDTAMAELPGTSLLPHASYPYDIKIKPDGSEAWIVGAVGDGVKVVDTATGQITQSIDLSGVGDYAVDVLFSVDGSAAYVSARDSEVLVVIDAATYTVDKTIDLGGTFDGGKMTIDPCTGTIYMVDWYDKSLLVIDPVTDVVTPTLIGTSLWDLQYDIFMNRLYVLDRGTDSVRVLNAETLEQIANVPVGDDPWGIDLTADGGLLVVACEDSHNVYFIDTATLINNNTLLAPDADPRDVSIHPDDVRAFVPTGDIAGDDGVYEIDLLTETVTTTIKVAPNTNSNIVAVRPQPIACP